MTPNLLVAGVGNIFLGDDGFGVEVVRRLATRSLPEDVRVVDFGIRGRDLSYALLDGYSAVVIVDATARRGAPGTLYVVEPTVEPHGVAGGEAANAHGIDVVRAIAFAAQMGERLPRLRLVGCEPQSFGSEEEPLMGLTAPVQRSIEPAIALVCSLLNSLRLEHHPDTDLTDNQCTSSASFNR